MRKKLTTALILIGFTSMVSQIVLMRELMIVFYGNELSLGITLAGWLFWVGIGGWGLGRFFVTRIKNKLLFFIYGEILAAFFPFLTLLAIRLLPKALGNLPGEIIGFLPMFYASFILLAPFCLLCGFLFVLGCDIYSLDKEKSAQIGYVYILDAIGTSIGGILASIILIRWFNSFFILTTVGFLNLIPAFLLFWVIKTNKKIAILSLLFVLITTVFVFCKINYLNSYSLQKQWKPFRLLTSQNSSYGNIVITQDEEQYTFFNNGLYMFTVPDLLTCEKTVHFAFLQHPSPQEVLLIGGGVGGVLEEMFKYPLKKIDYVELDPLVIKLAAKYIPSLTETVLNDSRLNLKNMDGRLFIKKTKNTYDVIIINLPEPFTAQLNRFYTKEFFKEIKRILRDDGVFCFGITSSPNYIGEEQKQLLLSLSETLKTVFTEVKVFPGDVSFFFAGKNEGTLTDQWPILAQRLKNYKIQTRYVRDYYLSAELSKERIDYLEQRLQPVEEVKINTDFRPISYFYDMILWNSYFNGRFKNLFKTITVQRIYLTITLFYIVIFVFILLKKKFYVKIFPWSILLAVFTTGFAEITFQVVTLLSFQIIYGYVYYKLSVILTSFMLGLILGGWWITKLIERKKGNLRLFIKIQLLVCIYPFILPLLFRIFSQRTDYISFYLGSNIVFALLPIIAGFIGGFQFPLANKLYLEFRREKLSKTAGLIYGLDLFGACLGAFLVSIFILPILGIPGTCLIVALLNIGSFLFLIF